MAARTFEKAFSELGTIVERLQKGDLALEETITLFEKGMRLSVECERFLDDAGRRVEVLVRGQKGELETEPFDEPEE
jgi:exodeoxyribonuclease VII small subunit